MFLTSYNTLGQGKSCKVTEECEPIKLASIKACPSSGKVVITAPPGIGYSVATGSDAQTVRAEEQSQNSGKPAGLALLERRSR